MSNAGTDVHFDNSHVLLSFLYPVKGGYEGLIFIFIFIYISLHTVIPLKFLLS